MAGDWIPFEKATLDKREVPILATALHLHSLDQVLGIVLRFWCWADSNTVDGSLPGVTTEMLDLTMKTPGLSAALLGVGWLRVRPTGLTIPNFSRHMGSSAKKRIQSALRSGLYRASRSRHAKNHAPDVLSSSVLFSNSGGGQRNQNQQNEKDSEVRPPVPASLRPRSDLECDNPEKFPAAKRIAELFQKLCPAHGRSLVEIIGRLNDGATEDELEAAASAYGDWCKASKKSPQHRLSLRSFFAPGGEWERFRAGMPEVVCEPAEESIAAKVQRINRGK